MRAEFCFYENLNAVDAMEHKEAEIKLCVSIGLGTASCRDVAVKVGCCRVRHTPRRKGKTRGGAVG